MTQGHLFVCKNQYNDEGMDVAKPSFKIGYVNLLVNPKSKHLAIDVNPEFTDYEPGDQVEVEIEIPQLAGKGYENEGAVMVVDEGVLLFSKRIGTLMFGLFYILPVYYPSSSSSLYKVARTTVRSGSSQTSSGMKSETSRSKPLGLPPSLSTIIRL